MKTVKDMNVEELKSVIREAILEVVDPDYGLELRDEAVSALKRSLKEQGKGISLEETRKIVSGI